MDGGRPCAPVEVECSSDTLSVTKADSPWDDASRRSRRQPDAHRVQDQATSADDVRRMTNSEADEYVEALLSWLLEREISGQVEADRLRSLNDEFRQFSRDDRQITDCAFFKAISRAGILRKDRRVARSDPRYARMCVQTSAPKVMVYTLPAIPELSKDDLRTGVLQAQGIKPEPDRLAA